MAAINSPQATDRLKRKLILDYLEGITVACGIGANESDHDDVAMHIVNSNSPILYKSSIDVEISRNGAYAIFLQSEFMGWYTALTALHEVSYSIAARRPLDCWNCHHIIYVS